MLEKNINKEINKSWWLKQKRINKIKWYQKHPTLKENRLEVW